MSSSRLPLPKFISDEVDKPDDSVTVNEDGRVRSYPHIRGQWTTFVFSEVHCDSFIHLTDHINSYGDGMNLVDDIHVSLIRGHYALSFHQITPFVSSLRDKLSNCQAFDVYLSAFKLFTNDEGTRSFVCLCQPKLQIDSTNSRTSRIVFDIIKRTLNEFNCCIKTSKSADQSTACDNSESDDFTFHTSLAWCLPESTESARGLIHQLNDLMDECITININTIKINTGNICHTISLKD